MKIPTKQRILSFIKKFFERYQFSPTYLEIAKGVGIASKGVIARYVKQLEDEDLIELIASEKRHIRLRGDSLGSIPLLGKIAAGNPIDAIQYSENFNVLDLLNLKHKNLFALKVKGDSMIEAGIYSGDIVICEKKEVARNGEIVVALIDRTEATLKRFYQLPTKEIKLMPENSDLKPRIFPANRVKIQGIYYGLIRLA